MKSILFVDDDEDDRNLFGMILSAIDGSIAYYTAADGIEALKVLHEDMVILPDMIFMDLNMPKMDGLTCLDHLKQHGEFRNIPVLMLSTSSNPRDVEKALQLGAEKFITKPASFDTFTSMIRNAICREPEDYVN